jgi:ubiquinone/menaquinone biosynthesis C-methylase UbiE
MQSATVTMALLFSMAGPDREEHHHGKHGNPGDLQSYIAKMESPDRDVWQKPEEVLRALQMQPGQVACDIGAGPGYFALRLAREVGDRGAVFAVDVEARILEVLRSRIEKRGVPNVVPVLGLPGDPLIPLDSCDLILVVDTFHHFPDGVSSLRRLARSLREGGRLVNIDFHKKELPVGPPVEHKVSREEFLSKAQAAGLVLKAEHQFLPHQYFLVFQGS